MDMLLEQTVIFAFMLAISLLIERIMEVLKSIYDYVDCVMDMEKTWSNRAVKLKSKMERAILSLERGNHKNIGTLIRQHADVMIDGKSDGVITISGDLVRATTVRFVAKIVAMLIGIGFSLGFGLDLIQEWQNAAGNGTGAGISTSGFALGDTSKQILTGIVLGLGAGPLHKIITTIERRRLKAEKGA